MTCDEALKWADVFGPIQSDPPTGDAPALLTLAAEVRRLRSALAAQGAGEAEPDMPSPTNADLADPLFEAIWQTIKSWDVQVPAYYKGYCGASGSHVMLILNAIRRPPASAPEAWHELIGAATRVVAMHDSELGRNGRAEAVAILKRRLNAVLAASPAKGETP